MLFGLKNAEVTYQLLVNMIFKKQIEKIMEAYVDDIMAKGKQLLDHIKILTETFNIFREYMMNLNPSKCTFRVSFNKFLGYFVFQWGTEAHLKQIELPRSKVPNDCRGDPKSDWACNSSQQIHLVIN